MAGAWAATTDRNKVVTLYDALVRKGLEVSYAEGYDMNSNQLTGLQEALQAAEASDVIVVAVGERFGQSGEKASKVNIAIPEGQQKLVSELAKTGKPVIALVMCGRPVIFNEIRNMLMRYCVLGGWEVRPAMPYAMCCGESIILRLNCP